MDFLKTSKGLVWTSRILVVSYVKNFDVARISDRATSNFWRTCVKKRTLTPSCCQRVLLAHYKGVFCLSRGRILPISGWMLSPRANQGSNISILLGHWNLESFATKSDVTPRLGGAERRIFFMNLRKTTFSEATEHASAQKRTETCSFVWCANPGRVCTLIRNRNSWPSLKG